MALDPNCVLYQIAAQLGVPHQLVGELEHYSSSSLLDQSVMAAFERDCASIKAGFEFCLAMMIDPLAEEGRKIIEEYRCNAERERRHQAERN